MIRKFKLNYINYINCQFNEERFKEIFKELDEFNFDKEVHSESMFSLFRTKMLYSAISSNVADKSLVNSLQDEVNYLQTENNKYSSEIINLNKQIEEYQESQIIALEEALASQLSVQDIRGLTIEELQNKLTKSNQNTEILLGEIDLKKSENIKLIKENEEFKNDFINNNFLLSFRKIQVAILNNKLNSLNEDLSREINRNEILSAKIVQLEAENNDLIKKYRDERLSNTGTLFLNSHFGSYLIKELNKCPLVNIDESHVETLNTALLFGKLAGYPNLQKYSIYLIIGIFSFMIFTYLLKLFTGIFLNTLNYFTS